MHTLTISGKPFTVEARYSEGHVLTANEAAALNQTFFENLRNNFAQRAKDGEDQTAFDEYAASYEFGVRTGGGSRDPVETEAMSLARDYVKQVIQKNGKKVSDYTAEQISTAAKQQVETNPVFREKAKERIAEMQAVASQSIDPSVMEALLAAPAAKDTSDAPVETDPNPSTDAPTEETAGGRRKKASAE